MYTASWKILHFILFRGMCPKKVLLLDFAEGFLALI